MKVTFCSGEREESEARGGCEEMGEERVREGEGGRGEGKKGGGRGEGERSEGDCTIVHRIWRDGSN